MFINFIRIVVFYLLCIHGSQSQSTQLPITCLFARPGAGKTTVANAVIELLGGECVGLDLDECVTSDMKSNFAKGIYPNRSEREAFMESACDFLQRFIEKKVTETPTCKNLLVSFSFVNDDLRDVFRKRFPSSRWVLLNVGTETASERIAHRKGHFYNGIPIVSSSLCLRFYPLNVISYFTRNNKVVSRKIKRIQNGNSIL